MIMVERLSVAPTAKEYVRGDATSSLLAALEDAGCPHEDLVSFLLFSCGHFAVAKNLAGASRQFYAGVSAGSMVLQVEMSGRPPQLSGPAVADLRAAYSILIAIEHELDAAVHLPPDMRRDRVKSACMRMGVSEDFFSAVLRNSVG